jgi:chemotaxis protein methyltransferase CheR
MILSPQQFNGLSNLLKNETAVILDTGKEYLVETRLSNLAREEGFSTLSDLIDAVLTKHNPQLKTKVLLALTTNETSFFRDLAPFNALQSTIIPQLLKSRESTRRLTIWSAACSAGQEPYSLAMLLRETFPQLASWNLSILASDLNPTVVAKAKEGSYTSIEVNRGLPIQYLLKYFEQKGSEYVIKPVLRDAITFFPLNLLHPWPSTQVDILFLRNVLIYFDVETKRQMFDKVYNVLAPDGYLFLGTAETPYRIHDGFNRITVGSATIYQKAS